ncbi:MAG: fluoride efflux transporter CrcB [Deltaproteobacteria bacterium]|nr:fluoride efflux transporter CrcB [Deltaproteobacteria bacterium]
MMGITHFLIFGLGGGLGAISRAWLSRVVDTRFPWATLIVNVVGSALVGILMAIFAQSRSLAAMDEELLANGFCGGFTTFSSFSYQTLSLFQNQKPLKGILNVLLNLVFALGGAWSGILIGEALFQ